MLEKARKKSDLKKSKIQHINHHAVTVITPRDVKKTLK